jgi:hypothetical protein
MPTYRYYTIPLLPSVGTQPVIDLELTSVHMDKALDEPGNFSATVRLEGNPSSSDIANATVPGYHAIVCKRDEVPIWAGPIWSQSYESQGRTMQITAQTYDSLWPWTPIVNDFVKGSNTFVQNALNDFRAAINAQLSGGNNYGMGDLTGPNFNGVSPSGAQFPPFRFLATDLKFESDFWDYARTMFTDQSAVTVVDITAGVGDAINKTTVLHVPLDAAPLFPKVVSGIDLEYPGTISAYWYPTGAANSGVRHVGIGPTGAYSVANSDMTVSSHGTSIPPGYPTTGWPMLTMHKTHSHVVDPISIPGVTINQAKYNRMPYVTPTFELTEPEMFDGWNAVGTWFKAYVRDERFPAGFQMDTPLAGWSLDPESSDTPEVIRLSSFRRNS